MEEQNREERIAHYRELGKKRRKKEKRMRQAVSVLVLVMLVLAVILALRAGKRGPDVPVSSSQGLLQEEFDRHPAWEEDFLSKNEYSRPGIALNKVENIFVHYVANPGTTAIQNRNYFESLGRTGERYASAHFIIGLDGEIVQCIPLNEIGYAVQKRNQDSVSIECCHPGEDGAFTEATKESLRELLGWLLEVYDLEQEDILRHYDSNGKLCPLYYVIHEDEWNALKSSVVKNEPAV